MGTRAILATVAALALGGISQAAPKPAARPVARAAPPPLSPIQQIFAAARADAKRQDADPYAATTPPPANAVGQSFKLVLPTSGIGTSANQIYVNGKLTFYVSLDSVPNDTSIPVSQWRHDKEIKLGGTIEDRGSYVGSNVFGATTVVSTGHSEQNAIVAVSYPPAASMPGTEQYHTEPTTYPLVMEVDGPTAKRIVETTRFVIEGTIAPLSNGKLSGCRQQYFGATFSNPYSGSSRTCWVGAAINRVAYVNNVTGEVLKEFIAYSKGEFPEVKPTAEQFDRYYPERAYRMGVSGTANLRCDVTADGSLSNCTISSEMPGDQGFGDAALRLSRFYKVDPARGGAIDLPVEFKLP